MKPRSEPGLPDEIEGALDQWRRRAANTLLTLVAVAIVPTILATMMRRDVPVSALVRLGAVALYMVVVAAAALRRIDFRARVWAVLLVAYAASIIALIHFNGPLAYVYPFGMPLVALVLIGPRSGWAAALISVALYLLYPLLAWMPSLEPWRVVEPSPTVALLARAVAVIGFLLPIMVLLDRFHRLQIATLTAERRTSARLEQEVVERTAAHEALRREVAARLCLEREVAAAADEERRRLGQEIHDGVCQELTGALLRCHTLERRLAQDRTLQPSDLRALGLLLEEAIGDAHDIARGLCPLDGDPAALAPALRVLAARTQESAGLSCTFSQSGDADVLDGGQAQHLYRIAQEAVNNAVSHARAGCIRLELRAGEGEIRLRVEDDGTGLPEQLPANGMGLRTMTYRAQMLGGTLAIDRAPEGGTRVTCRLPCGGAREPEGAADEP